MAPGKKPYDSRIAGVRKLPLRRAKSWALKKISNGRRMSTTRLPIEILIDVMSALSRFDLDGVRLSNRRLEQVISERMQSLCLRVISYINIRALENVENTVRVDIQAKRNNNFISLQLEGTKEQFLQPLLAAVQNGAITGGIYIDTVEVDANFLSRLRDIGDAVKLAGYVNLHKVSFAKGTEPIALLDCFQHVKSYGDRDCNTAINDAFLSWCLQKGISRLTVDYEAKITNAGILSFCFGGPDPAEDRRELRVCQLMPFSEEFLDKLIKANKECGHHGPLYARVNIEWIELDVEKYREFVTTELRRRTVIHEFRFPNRFRVRYTGSCCSTTLEFWRGRE